MIKVLGVDPSLSNFGFALMEVQRDGFRFDTRLIELHLESTESEKSKQVRKNSSDLERARKLIEALRIYEDKADVIIAEVPVGSQSARAMASYGVCVGVLASIRKPLIQVTPNEVKIAAVNDKTASKEEMIKWAVGQYPNANWLRQKDRLVAKNEHLADAVAAIHAGLRHDDFKLMATILSK